MLPFMYKDGLIFLSIRLRIGTLSGYLDLLKSIRKVSSWPTGHY